MFHFFRNRFTFKMNMGCLSCLFLLAKTQRLEGITSLLLNGKHIVLADIEDCSLEEAEKELLYVQQKYSLSDIFIVSDRDRSYRAFCYSQVDYKTLLKILLDIPHLDMVFFNYTVKRKKATLRVSNKKDRQKQELVSVLKSYSAPIPDEVEKVIYDTGIVKKGIQISLGDDD
ncbi:MAG: hypothetical protein A2W22_06145 [Candidatus Levybacteria bacterium RBG_16_35_11]|nr:MAG: hypothetical protein A2W22_06145 [Candidatus Levybacteria bacterium RBG_16_35_11]